jgi:hypothetical protein
MIGEPVADRARALHQDRGAIQIRRTARMAPCRPDAVEHAQRRPRRRIVRTTPFPRASEHVPRALADHVHVRGTGVHVRRRDVGPVEGVDEGGISEQDLAARRGAWWRHGRDGEDGLAAPVREVRYRLFEGHRLREAKDVAETIARSVVRLHPGAAHRGPEHRRMHTDEHPGLGRLVEPGDQLFAIPARKQVLEHGHESMQDLPATGRRRWRRAGHAPRPPAFLARRALSACGRRPRAPAPPPRASRPPRIPQ